VAAAAATAPPTTPTDRGQGEPSPDASDEATRPEQYQPPVHDRIGETGTCGTPSREGDKPEPSRAPLVPTNEKEAREVVAASLRPMSSILPQELGTMVRCSIC
jgi:hypothetical protein